MILWTKISRDFSFSDSRFQWAIQRRILAFGFIHRERRLCHEILARRAFLRCLLFNRISCRFLHSIRVGSFTVSVLLSNTDAVAGIAVLQSTTTNIVIIIIIAFFIIIILTFPYRVVARAVNPRPSGYINVPLGTIHQNRILQGILNDRIAPSNRCILDTRQTTNPTHLTTVNRGWK